MVGEFDAVGDAVTGGLLARAVEPHAGEVDKGHTHEKNCLNCGTPLTGPFCSACGQKAHVHRSVRGFLEDFVRGLFNFEGKIWRTLPMLAWCPGLMTRRYIAGERARFVSPVALYLFTVFAMFAVLNLTGALGSSTGAKNFKEGLKTEIAQDKAQLAKLDAQRKAGAAAGKNVAALDRKIASRKEDIAENLKMFSGQPLVVADADDQTPGFIRPFIKHAKDNPELVSMRVQDAASKYSWLLIPLSVPFMWLLFPLRKRYNMIVTINFDGRVIDTEVVETSGNLALDRRAKTIARNAGPFGRFSDAMRRKADQIVVVSRFKFTRDETLETNLTSR